MLIVGVDTYITVAEADEYVSTHRVSTDPLRVQWEAMSESDKEVYLRKAFDQINSLPYVGKPMNPKQQLPFPRKLACWDNTWTEQDQQRVKNAQAAQSVAATDAVAAQEVENRIALRRAGVKQYKIGDLSEQFIDGLPADSNANFFGLEETAYHSLSKWLRGGYKVCTSIKPHFGIRWRYLV